MLFRRSDLVRIADGSVTLAFRRWDRPHAKAGSRVRTAVGVLTIDTVEPVTVADLCDETARRAGYGSLAELVRDLDRYDGGQLYRIEVRLTGDDPRVALRAQAELGPEELAALRARLARMDARSGHGPWTWATLRLIAQRPAVRAGDLAGSLGRDRLPFKADVRKLKEPGLTESLDVGYRLSPRGQALLASVDEPSPEAGRDCA
jgi:hypothetical protein